ncbi:TPA: DUF4832 domain-containing protein, partial [Raoultella planticola]
QVQWRVVNALGEVVARKTTQDDIRQWLPGSYQSQFTLALPATLTSGKYQLEVALTNDQGTPRIRLANEGGNAEGWYPMASFNIKE